MVEIFKVVLKVELLISPPFLKNILDESNFNDKGFLQKF